MSEFCLVNQLKMAYVFQTYEYHERSAKELLEPLEICIRVADQRQEGSLLPEQLNNWQFC